MPTDNASVIELVQAIGNVSHELREEGASLCDSSREELIRNAERLAIAAREPEENLYFQATQVRIVMRVWVGKRRLYRTHVSHHISVVPDSPECCHQGCYRHGRFRSDTFLWQLYRCDGPLHKASGR